MKVRKVIIYSEAAQLGNSGGSQTRGKTGPARDRARIQCQDLPRQQISAKGNTTCFHRNKSCQWVWRSRRRKGLVRRRDGQAKRLSQETVIIGSKSSLHHEDDRDTWDQAGAWQQNKSSSADSEPRIDEKVDLYSKPDKKRI
jgi:hypothetical protein